MKKILLILPILLLFIAACKKDSSTKPQVFGSISGKVILYDEFGIALSNNSGMVVTAKGDSTYSVSTDSTGAFKLSSVYQGQYSLEFSKSGYGTYKRYGFNINDQASTVTLSTPIELGQLPTTVPGVLSSVYNSVNNFFTFNCSITPSASPAEKRSVRLFFDKTSSVSNTQYTYTPSFHVATNSANCKLDSVLNSDLITKGFSTGDTVWVVAYGEGIKPNSYPDQNSSKTIYPNLNLSNPSNKISIVIN